MSDSSDSETPVVESVQQAKRVAGSKTSHRQPTNFAIPTPPMIAGHVLKESGVREATVMQVAEALEAEKIVSRKRDKKDEDVYQRVRNDFAGDAPGGHDMGAFVNTFTREPNEMVMRASPYLRRVSNRQEMVVGGGETDGDTDQAIYELRILMQRSMSQLSITRDAVVNAYGMEPEDVLVKRMIEMIEEQDVWSKALKPSGSMVQDGVLIVSDYVPDFGTPSSLPYINNSLSPYVSGEPFTLPCSRGALCIKSGHTIPGIPHYARAEPPAPYKAWIPPDVHTRWREQGKEPDPEWTCFFCHVREVEQAAVMYARKKVTPPPLNRHEVVVDSTGISGFPEQMLFHQGRNTVHNGVYGAFPRESMLQYAPKRKKRGRDGGQGSAKKNAGWNIVIPDFRFASAVNGMVSRT